MIRALLYLRLTSLQNRVLVTLRRLRQPRYMLGAVAGAAYLYFFIFGHLRGSYSPFAGASYLSDPTLPALYTQSLLRIGGSILFILVLWRQAMVWKSPPAEAGLRFSEAEIAFLFPAPLSRRRLVHFSLIKSQLLILLSSLFLALFFSRRGGVAGTGLIHALGWWVILSALNFHTTAVSLTVVRLRQTRPNFPQLRRVALGLLALLATAAGAAFYRGTQLPVDPNLGPGLDLIAFLGKALNTGILHYLLLPFSGVAAPYLANTPGQFLHAVLPALALLALLYAWVVRLEVPFEDGSIALAERRSQGRPDRRFGGFSPPAGPAKALREPFTLAERGRPEIAFLWKNLFAIQSWFNLRLFLGALALIAAMVWSSAFAHGLNRVSSYAPLALIGSAMLAFYTLLAGPQLLRQDLRGDLANADILKTYPLAGWQVVLGEILTPLAILTGLLWLALLVGIWAVSQVAIDFPWLTRGLRIVLTLCLASVIPPVCVLQLLIPNAAALLFPTWFQAARARSGSVEIIGQRMIFAGGQLLAVLAALVPPLATAAVLVFASQWLIGPAAATILATLAALAIVLLEAACGIWWLGQRFEQLDFSTAET